MRRFLRLFDQLRAGPHGPIVVGALGISLCLCVAILLSSSLTGGVSLIEAVALCGVLGTLDVLVIIAARMRAKINDIHDLISFEAGLRRAGYRFPDLFLDQAAATPSLQLLHLKILRLYRPENILEIGSGQTTKLVSSYVQENPSAYALSLEQNADWAARLRVEVVHDYRHIPLEESRFVCKGSGLRLETRWHGDLPEFHERRFNYILVDGPDHGRTAGRGGYSRCGILRYLPEMLADSFIVVFDDAERHGEMMTVRALKDILEACQIAHVSFALRGVKTQVVFCSPDCSYLRSV